MQHFVTEFDGALSQFDFLDKLVRFPTIDREAVLDMLVEHLQAGVPTPWPDYVRELLYKGQIVENMVLRRISSPTRTIWHQENGEFVSQTIKCTDDRILIDAIAQVGVALEAHLKHFGLYHDRQLPYVYQGCIGNDIYEFVQKPDA
jgi:hypothetical protein